MGGTGHTRPNLCERECGVQTNGERPSHLRHPPKSKCGKMPGEVEMAPPPPPPVNKSGLKRTKSTKKKRSASVHPDRISPLKRQLEEARTWTREEIPAFLALKTARERVALVYSLLPFDATGLDRLWPIQIVQKDSRIRRKLCERGKELFVEGEWEQALHHYNEACLFSSEKGAYEARTGARRASGDR